MIVHFAHDTTEGTRLIPLRDENPTRTLPWVTFAIAVANVAVFAYEWVLPPEALDAFIQTYAFVPSRFLASPLSPAQLLTVFTAMFMHAGPIHLGGNMLYLWIFGNNIEDRLGHGRFVLFYLACGIAATAAQTAAGPGSSIPTLGASGAVAGVLGAYAWLFPRANVITLIPLFFFFEIARVPALLVIGLWFVLQLALEVLAVVLDAGLVAIG
jgi:membrane associated rhomboid family serine protease